MQAKNFEISHDNSEAHPDQSFQYGVSDAESSYFSCYNRLDNLLTSRDLPGNGKLNGMNCENNYLHQENA
jgi:hypothetical protein